MNLLIVEVRNGYENLKITEDVPESVVERIRITLDELNEFGPNKIYYSDFAVLSVSEEEFLKKFLPDGEERTQILSIRVLTVSKENILL
jgi:hypothetical protein